MVDDTVPDLSKFSDLQIFAGTLFGEARGEGAQGIQAVANVVTYRKNNPTWWGDDWRSVCLHKYQFSCWLASLELQKIIDAMTAGTDPTYLVCLDTAQKAMAGTLPDITNGADNYYAKGTPTPKWALNVQPLLSIGHHLFFNV